MTESPEKKPNIFQRIRRRFDVRKIQFDILTIFLVLLTASSIIILYFSYTRDYKGILKLSNSIIVQVSDVVSEKIDDVADQAQLLSATTKGAITSADDVSCENDKLIAYLHNSIKSDPLVYSIVIGAPNGNYMSIRDVPISGQTNFISKPNDPLPPGTKYALTFIDRTGPTPTEYWLYKGTDFTTLATELVSPVTYDPRTDFWYKQTAAWPHLTWTNEFSASMNQVGLTVSTPVLDDQGKVMAIIGINLSLNVLSNFITHQRVGETGRAFILDNTGTILVPIQTADSKEEIDQTVVTTAYNLYSHSHQHVLLIKQNGVEYIASITDFPVALSKKWLIAVIVPFNDFFGTIIRTQRDTIHLSLIVLLIFGILVYFSSKHISRPIIKLAKEVDMLRNFDFTEPPQIKSNVEEIITLNSSVAAMRSTLLSFSRYLPKEVVRTLMAQGKEIVLGGEKRELTVMFMDIANFTTMAEGQSVETTMTTLTEYFNKLSQIILESNGTIDKYIGDCIMAFWNAPQSVPDRDTKACLTALRCHKAAQWPTRFGINDGEVIVGNIGASERMNYTVIGDAVNAAARLQAINKDYHTSILISETVKQKIGPDFIMRPIDFVAVKGKKIKIKIYELVGTKDENKDVAATSEQIELCKIFAEAYESFHHEKLEEAKNQFLAIKDKFPDDYPTKLYLDRIEALSSKGKH